MKVQLDKMVFLPLTIRIETEEELNILLEMLGSVTGAGAAREVVDSVYTQILDIVDDQFTDSGKIPDYFKGTLHCVN